MFAPKKRLDDIFGEGSRKIFCRDYENHFKHCSEVIKALFQFAVKDLFVIRNTHSGMISAVEQVNMVLFTIIPGMKIDVYHYGMKLTDSGENGYCLAIDELDAGIFEYMLGELLGIFN